MELQLTDGDIQLDGSSEFELPAYMVRISEEDVTKEEIPSDHIIIAAGADPSDGKIMLVTLSGRILLFDARSFYIPDGPAIPFNGGTEIFLENSDGRWPGDSDGFYMDSKWVIEKSAPALTGATIKVNY